jgi:hypothetical protein
MTALERVSEKLNCLNRKITRMKSTIFTKKTVRIWETKEHRHMGRLERKKEENV